MRVFCKASIVTATAIALLGSLHAQTPRQGELLVATSALTDPNFAQSIVLLVRHDENGTIGLLINRPTWVEPATAFPDLAPFEEHPDRLFFGGPVAPTRLLLLLRNPPPGATEDPPIFADIYVSGNPEVLNHSGLDGSDESRLRMYAGRAEWAAGQLNEEIAAGSWNIVRGKSDWVFSPNPSTLWREAASLAAELVVDASGAH